MIPHRQMVRIGMNETHPLYPRSIEKRIAEAMADTPVVLIVGPRQTGKTTLVRQIAARGSSYLTLDDELTLLAAREDPAGMIRGRNRVIIDEIQRAPQLLPAIKRSVDEDRRPGRFLLTGSANLMTLPTVAESLAGRMETLKLLPLSQSELRGTTTNWIEAAFAGRLPQADHPLVGDELVAAVLRGGYPEAVSRPSARRRMAWARQYLDAIIQRDVRDIANIDKIDRMPRFLRVLAQVSGQLCNYTQLGGQVGLDHKTAARYTGILEQMYLLQRVEPWSANRLSRVVKTPKLQFVDSGLLAALTDLTPELAQRDRSRFGSLLETFVFAELLKHTTTADGDYRLLHYRDHDQFEVDLVIENAAGELVAVEVKAAATVRQNDLRGMKRLAETAGERLRLGVVLYDGTEALPLGEKLLAAPLSSLWGS